MRTEGHLRIIAGEWRGRKFSFKATEGLRPTPDRVKETLFNWLQNDIYKARCLDLFCGSGSLGLEALSRGAQSCSMVDNNANALSDIKNHIDKLGANSSKPIQVKLAQQDVMQFLHNNAQQQLFDVVFVDPPYKQGLVAECITALEQNNWLTDSALIYLEAEKQLQNITLPPNWQLLRSKIAGQVGYHLAMRNPP